MERDAVEYLRSRGISISTHTLTWSVTYVVRKRPYFKDISTHTLTWSVTLLNALDGDDEQISTHTLTWSVTSHP